MRTCILFFWVTSTVLTAAAPEEILLWPNGAPGSEGKSGSETVVPSTDGIRRVAGIHHPSITVFLPPKDKATGAAAIILPGGGHRYLSIDNEGYKFASWLSERGIAGFVLKYRLAREEGSTYQVEQHAVQDAQRALRLVRSRAKEWNLNPDRVGFVGFSAGGQVAAFAGVRFDAGKTDVADPLEKISSRPAFQALIYSGSLPADVQIPKDAPPVFLCVAFDDKGPTGTALNLIQKFRDAGISTELHLYAKGGHGFGMKDRPIPITSWPFRFQEWMTGQEFGNVAKPPLR